MTEITSHITASSFAEALLIQTMDEQGPGGANHVYHITQPNGDITEVNFQKGGIKEVGVNGITNEALLAVVMHRLQCFNDGPFPSRENSLALTKCQEAMHWLHARTRDRQSRGVEGIQAE